MRLARLAFPLLFACAATAHAAPVRMVVRDVPLHGSRALAVATPTFNMAGVHWQGSGAPWFRTRSVTGRWSAWQEADDDWGRSGVWRQGHLAWTGAANAIQLRTAGRVTRVREYLLWSPPVRVQGRRLQLVGSPSIITRSGWKADESIRRATPNYAPTLQLASVHHTASTNAYSCLQSASIVRGIETYHVKGNGWNDIGYNFLVDSCGQIFEGRYGGADKNVIGAHSQGFNAGSVGVAVLGTYGSAVPAQAAQTALVNLLAWRLDVAHVDPLSFIGYVSGGNSKYPAGIPVNLRAVSGHRDTYFTDCPGDVFYKLLPTLAQRISRTGLPKLYSPNVTGSVGGPMRFTARLSAALPWTVTIVDPAGAVAGVGTGTGTTIDWTWDSTSAIPGAAYTWTIAAGTGVRPATGTIGGKLAALALTKLQASPQLVDGTTVPSAMVTYTLSVAATVTADLVSADGVVQQTLFSESKQAGEQSFVFTVSDLQDGNYAIRLTARDALGRQAQATVPVTVSRALLRFSADSKLVSPNGDGRRDTATFNILLTQPATVRLTFATAGLTIPVETAELPAGDQRLTFSGTGEDGSLVPDGIYTATLTVQTPPFAVTQSLPLTVDTTPPDLSLVSLLPLRLKTDERVTVIATLNGRRITMSAKPGTFRLGARQTVRTLRAIVRDAAGNTSAPVTYRKR